MSILLIDTHFWIWYPSVYPKQLEIKQPKAFQIMLEKD